MRSMRLLLAASALLALLPPDAKTQELGAALAPVAAAPATAPPPTAGAGSQTVPTRQGGSNMAVIAVDAANPSRNRIVGTAGLAGLEIYGLNGKRLGQAAAGEAVGLDIRSGVALGAAAVTLMVSADATDNSLRVFAFENGALREIGARPIPLGFAVENVCLYKNAQDGGIYAFAVGDGGEIDQHLLFAAADGRIDARRVRRLHVPSPAEYCVVDDAAGQLYVSEQAVGVWRFNADPETDIAPSLVDTPRLGRITEEVGGLALYDGAEGARWLIASDASSGRLFAYDRGKDDAYVGAIAVTAPAGGAPVEEPAGLYATSASLGSALPNGALLVADEDAQGGANYKLLAFESLARPLGLGLGAPVGAAPTAPPRFPVVRAAVETASVGSSGDAADDPAIWIDPGDPSRSLIIGTDKKGGLHLYDMQGRIVQFAPDGKMNNVDLREGFQLGGKPVVLVTASDRTNKAIAIYALDTTARRLVNVADGVQPTGLSDPYGLCMYRGARGKHYVVISDPDGRNRQWELVATRNGKVRAKLVRELKFGSQTEGCVADDAAGLLYVGEEDVGLWRVNAEPGGGEARRAVATVAANPRLKDDIEGVGIYDLGGGRGYIVASSQGNNSYAVFRREGDQAYLGSFAVVADGARGIDGVSETDGLEVTSRSLGPGFETGAMVAQDGRNVLPSENQNFKIVAWSDIAAALKLESRR